MITQRFRPLGWVAGIAAAATMLYMISLQVASERGRLEEVDRKIAATQRDIRQLQTELGTRASLRQLEKWNSDVLALNAPGAGQYLPQESSLASVDRGKLGAGAAPPPPVMMAVMTQTPEVPAQPKPDLIAKLTGPKEAPKPMTKADKAVQSAIAPKPVEKLARAEIAKAATPKVAMLQEKLLDKKTMSDISRTAAGETGKKAKAKP